MREHGVEDEVKLDAAAWERWRSWIEKVKDDLQTTVNDKALFDGFRDVVVENWNWIGENDGDYFCDLVRRSYVAKVALGIRRLVKDDESASLMRVLAQMSKCAPKFTFDFYLQRFPADRDDPDDPWQRHAFRQISEDGVVASNGIIATDIEELQRVTMQVAALADREIAHLDLRGITGTVTFGDLDSGVDTLDRIACKYIWVLTGVNYLGSLKAKIRRDWKTIFDVPLREPRKTLEA